jgi:hypothetical protein
VETQSAAMDTGHCGHWHGLVVKTIGGSDVPISVHSQVPYCSWNARLINEAGRFVIKMEDRMMEHKEEDVAERPVG